MKEICIEEELAKNNGVVIKTDGTIEVVEPKDKNEWSLEELQHAVGGYIEIHPDRVLENALIICDEEGIIKGKPLNQVIYFACGIQAVGDVIIILDKMLK